MPEMVKDLFRGYKNFVLNKPEVIDHTFNELADRWNLENRLPPYGR